MTRRQCRAEHGTADLRLLSTGQVVSSIQRTGSIPDGASTSCASGPVQNAPPSAPPAPVARRAAEPESPECPPLVAVPRNSPGVLGPRPAAGLARLESTATDPAHPPAV